MSQSLVALSEWGSIIYKANKAGLVRFASGINTSLNNCTNGTMEVRERARVAWLAWAYDNFRRQLTYLAKLGNKLQNPKRTDTPT